MDNLNNLNTNKFYMRNWIFVIVLVFLIVPLVSADNQLPEAQYYAQQYSFLDINRGCIMNGAYCSPSTNCNLTLYNPNGNVLLANKPMSNNISFYNVSVGQLIDFGYHKADMTCSINNLSGSDTFYIEVTADGKPSQTFPYQIVIIIIGFILTLIGLYIKEYSIIKNIGSIMMMVMGVVTLYPGYSYINNTTLTGWMIGVITIGLGFFFLMSDYFAEDKQQEYYSQE